MYSNIPAIGCLVALVSRDHLDLKMGIPPMYVSAVMLTDDDDGGDGADNYTFRILRRSFFNLHLKEAFA